MCLKLYLAFLWFASAPPHYVTYRARAWAGLLGLYDPEGNGARRVVDAITWLAKEEFVAVRRRAGQPSEVRLLSDLGTGEPYEPPHETLAALDQREITTPTASARRTLLPMSPCSRQRCSERCLVVSARSCDGRSEGHDQGLGWPATTVGGR